MPTLMTNPALPVEPMLATRPRAGLAAEEVLERLGEEWIFEPKLDGFRCLMHVVGGKVILRSRTGGDITRRFRATKLPDLGNPVLVDPLVIDGELIATDDRGRPSFNRVQQIHGRPRDPIAVLVAFDVLYHPELLDVRNRPWTHRRSLLEELQPAGLTLTPYSASADAIWQAVLDQSLEGVIAKRKNSHYRAGRTEDWIKLKHHRTLSALATGFNTGEGSRNDSFGSLAIALFNSAGALIPIGNVGTGFAQTDLAAIRKLDPPFVIEVQFQEWTGTALRMPVFQGLRQDVPTTDCTFALQLPESDDNN